MEGAAAARLRDYNAYFRKDKRLKVTSKHPSQAARKNKENKKNKTRVNASAENNERGSAKTKIIFTRRLIVLTTL